MPKSQNDDAFLADEIRASESLYVEAAVEAFRKRIVMEYPRMRGYAIEAGEDRMQLAVTVTMCFREDNRHVIVQSLPKFMPAPGADSVSVSMPDVSRT